jgi:hypothetical protein
MLSSHKHPLSLLIASAALYGITACARPAPSPAPGGGAGLARPDLVATSASLKITGSWPDHKSHVCDVEVVIKNQGHAPIEAAEAAFVVTTALRLEHPPSGAYIPPTLFSRESALGGPGHPVPEPVALVTSGLLDVGHSRVLHAAGVLDTRGYTDVELVVTVDDCASGKPPCVVDEENETNNVLVVPLGNIGKAP